MSFQSLRHPIHLEERADAGGRQLRITQEASLIGELEHPGEVWNGTAGVQAADHLEAGLMAVEPGEERDPRLVVERRRTEDVQTELSGRIENRASL